MIPLVALQKLTEHCNLTLNEDPRNEMARDLLNLASSLRSENDLPEVFQWMANGKQASD